ncbi:MAG TPA: hypothetical protein VE981_14690 [Planctomycetota bacterium]|nr:hypothetical protein [Planctomycetota bacterium]
MMTLLLALLAAQDLQEGSVVDVGGFKVTVTRIDALPCVESDYTRRFRFDSADNPKLKELRETYRLDDVVAAGKDEFDRQVLLLDWTHHQFKKFGRPTANPKGALEILKGVEEGQTFFCAHYGATYCSAAASLGWVDRTLALRRHKDYPGAGAPEHTSTEIWSNQYRKWAVMDPTADMYVEKDGVPLNGVEIRTEWFEREGKDLVFVVGRERKRHRKADLPIFLGRFPGFGDLTVPANEMEKYGFIGYVPNTNLMDAGDDYGRMFIVKDHWCEGTKWHERVNPANPAVDPYFPLGQAAPGVSVDGGALKVALRTMTPNFKEYRARIDGGPWAASAESLTWTLHAGSNKLELKTVNRFGVDGPVSTIEVNASR